MTRVLEWRCDVCGHPIGNGRGYLSASDQDIASGDPVTWVAQHDKCRHQEFSYWVAVEQVRSVEDAISWTKHLAGKNWYSRSDWTQVMARQGVDVTEIARMAS